MKIRILIIGVLAVLTLSWGACTAQGTSQSTGSGGNSLVSSQVAPLSEVRLEPAELALRPAEEHQFVVTGLDGSGDSIAGIDIVFNADSRAGQISNDGKFVAGTEAGNYVGAVTVEVTHGQVTVSGTANLTIRPGPVSTVLLNPQSAELDIGGIQGFRAEAADVYGNPVQEARIIWAAEGDAGTISDDGSFLAGTVAGTFTEAVKATASFEEFSVEATATVKVNPGPPVTLSIPQVEISAGETQQIAAFASDQHGNHLEEAQVTWEVNDSNAGSISPSGLLTAGSVAGKFEAAIEAQGVTGDLKATTSVEIVPTTLAQIVIAPNPVDIGMGMKQTFVAAGADQYGNRIPELDFEWSVEEGAGTIDANGLLTAGNRQGTYNRAVKATAYQGGLVFSDTATVTVQPDRIAFVSDRNGGKDEVYVMNVNGSDVRRLTYVEAYSPAWLPSGQRILYQSIEAGGIVEVNDDGSWPVLIAEDFYGERDTKFTQNPSVSPDGRYIALEVWAVPFLDNGEYDLNNFSTDIYRVDVDGGNIVRLTDTTDGNEFVPSWSPDGSQIIYDFTRSGQNQNGDIWVMDSDGNNRKRLASSNGNDTMPSFSPDGTQILFMSNRDGDYEIYVMDVNGGNLRQLTNNSAADGSPAWAPDGRRIVFASDRGGNLEIYIMDRAGARQTRLTDDPAADLDPRWAPRKRGVEVDQAAVVIPNASTPPALGDQEASKRVGGAVVRIETDLGAGSGFIFDPNGLVLTNNHVIRGAATVTVFLDDGTRFQGKVTGRDLVRDLAVVEINDTDLPWLELGDVSRAPIGSDLLALGYPLGLTGLTITTGTTSGVKYDAGRNITFVQTDAVINPGNSGGPMLNTGGEVIGMVTSVIFEGFGLATSANTINLYLERLKAGEIITN